MGEFTQPANNFWLGIRPASESLVAFTRIMNRIWVSQSSLSLGRTIAIEADAWCDFFTTDPYSATGWVTPGPNTVY